MPAVLPREQGPRGVRGRPRTRAARMVRRVALPYPRPAMERSQGSAFPTATCTAVRCPGCARGRPRTACRHPRPGAAGRLGDSCPGRCGTTGSSAPSSGHATRRGTRTWARTGQLGSTEQRSQPCHAPHHPRPPVGVRWPGEQGGARGLPAGWRWCVMPPRPRRRAGDPWLHPRIGPVQAEEQSLAAQPTWPGGGRVIG